MAMQCSSWAPQRTLHQHAHRPLAVEEAIAGKHGGKCQASAQHPHRQPLSRWGRPEDVPDVGQEGHSCRQQHTEAGRSLRDRLLVAAVRMQHFALLDS